MASSTLSHRIAPQNIFPKSTFPFGISFCSCLIIISIFLPLSLGARFFTVLGLSFELSAIEESFLRFACGVFFRGFNLCGFYFFRPFYHFIKWHLFFSFLSVLSTYIILLIKSIVKHFLTFSWKKITQKYFLFLCILTNTKKRLETGLLSPFFVNMFTYK